MPDLTDHALIEEYARTGSEAAFSELTHRHVDLVHSTAFRLLRNTSLAEEVTQRVFVALARNASRLRSRSLLTGWLHETTRNFAVTTIRSEERRRLREQHAVAMDLMHDTDNSQALWDRMAPQLDSALALLDEADRDAILLRYFERKTAREIGERLGLTEEAAQKRATRALDRLRTIFAERGLAAPATAVAGLLSTQAIQSAPAGLTASVIAAAGTAEAVAGATSTSTIGLIMTSTKIKIGLAAALIAAASIPLVIQHQTNTRLRGEIEGLSQQGAELARLREELRRLTAESQSLAAQGEKDRSELARLRGLLAAANSRETKTPGAAKSPRAAAPRTPTDTSAAEEGKVVQRDEWRNIGFQVPSATVQTLEWAKINGDTNVIANGLAWADENSRAGVAAIFAAAPESVRARYGSADQYVLSLFNHSAPAGPRHTLLSYRIIEENVTGDEAILLLEYHYADGSTPTAPQRFVHIGNEWRMALDFDAPSRGKMNASLQGDGANAGSVTSDK